MSRCDVLAIGPGMGVGGQQENLVRWAIGQEKPVVIDADALNNLARIHDWPSLRRCQLILTPHPGELSRLTCLSVAEIQTSRPERTIEASRKWFSRAATDAPLILALKGAGTIVTDGQAIFENDTGNPGMASGGSGDVLTGLIAALLGQGLCPLAAGVLGVHTHGRAGDLAAQKLGEISLMASDLLDYLPAALKEAMQG
jgi:NAD(P)H-hydrate epimerase